ncbi:MAG TPA: hypothetical protein VIK11_12555 [Tepidiformaceae bacterium]
MASPMLAKQDQTSIVDNVNHDLLHSISVRLDAQWHDRGYEAETTCPDCRKIFDRLSQMDREAARLLTGELAAHVRASKFPVDLSD